MGFEARRVRHCDISDGAVITNASQDSTRQYNLPAAAAGMTVTFWVRAAQTMKIEPNGTDQIEDLTNAAGDSITSDAVVNSFITLSSPANSQWRFTGIYFTDDSL